MTEEEIIETAIEHIQNGRMYDAAQVLRESSDLRSPENAANCERLAGVPAPFLVEGLIQVLGNQLESIRAFGPVPPAAPKEKWWQFWR